MARKVCERMHVLVVGSFTMDYTVETERFPETGETVIGMDYKVSMGGKGANQAMAARLLKSEVSMVGMVGHDAHGDTILDTFKKQGVHIDHVKRSDSKSGLASIAIDERGENRIVMVPGANLDYTPQDLREVEEVLKSADIVMTQLEISIDVVEALSKMCSALHKSLVLNPAPAQPLSDEILKNTTYLTPNETELAMLVGKTKLRDRDAQVEAARTLLEKGVDHVIVTLGEKGSMLVDAEGVHVEEGFNVETLDTVAAGDAFNGAFAHALAMGKTIKEAMLYANAAGALAVTKYGAINALPTSDEVTKFIENQHD